MANPKKPKSKRTTRRKRSATQGKRPTSQRAKSGSVKIAAPDETDQVSTATKPTASRNLAVGAKTRALADTAGKQSRFSGEQTTRPSNAAPETRPPEDSPREAPEARPGEAFGVTSRQSLSRFSDTIPETGPRRLLRSQQQRKARFRTYFYIGGCTLLVVMLIGLATALFPRKRTRLKTDTEIASESTPEPMPVAIRKADTSVSTPAEMTEPTTVDEEPKSLAASIEDRQGDQPESIGELLGPVETRKAPEETSPSIELAMAESSAPSTSLRRQETPLPEVEDEPPRPPTRAASETKSTVDLSEPWTNSLGMKFVPVGDVLFSVWETRVKDFEEFCKATGHERKRAPFEESAEHPVSRMSWNDAQEFCIWLTQIERTEGNIGANQRYRLPTDLEWSLAVGIEGETGSTPEARDGQVAKTYPWGKQWPPAEGSGNFADQTASSILRSTVGGYRDGYVRSAPVGSFAANTYGIHDLSGNLWEWCQDAYGGSGKLREWRVMRGGSWSTARREELLSTYRNVVNPESRELLYGFRCVLVEE